MNKEKALEMFYSHVKKDYGEVEVLGIEERGSCFMIDFSEKDDEFPVDYPVIYINKTTGKIKELSYLDPDDRKIIMGDNDGKSE